MRQLKPSFIIVGDVAVRGGVQYTVNNPDEWEEGSEHHKRWETHRTIFDPEEYNSGRATKARLQRQLNEVCTRSAIGLICPYEFEDRYREIVESIKSEIKDWNDIAKTCKLSFYPVEFEIEGANQKVAEALMRQLIELMEDLREALNKGDFKEVRNLLRNKKGFSEILPDDLGQDLREALESAREQAKELAKQARENADQFELVQRAVDTSKVSLARLAFVEYADEVTEVIETPKVSNRLAAVGAEV